MECPGTYKNKNQLLLVYIVKLVISRLWELSLECYRASTQVTMYQVTTAYYDKTKVSYYCTFMALFKAQVAPLITITIPWSSGALRFINYLFHCKSLLKKVPLCVFHWCLLYIHYWLANQFLVCFSLHVTNLRVFTYSAWFVSSNRIEIPQQHSIHILFVNKITIFIKSKRH